MWDYCLQHLSSCCYRLRFFCKAIFPEGTKFIGHFKSPLHYDKLNTEHFTENPSFSQQVFFVDLSWNILIIKAALGSRK